MKKKIGTRIVVMLLVMTIMYAVSSVCSGFAQEQALGGMNRINNNWTQLERLELQLVKNVENCKFYTNMIVWYQNKQAATSLAQGIPSIVAETTGRGSMLPAIYSKELMFIACHFTKKLICFLYASRTSSKVSIS